MKEKLNMGIEIDKELIESNVSNAVCVAIASALGDKDELIGKAVKAVISSYVDSDGRPCSSRSYRAIPYLKYLTEQSIKESVKNEIAKMVEENKEQFSATTGGGIHRCGHWRGTTRLENAGNSLF